jgi:hypothetical protein
MERNLVQDSEHRHMRLDHMNNRSCTETLDMSCVMKQRVDSVRPAAAPVPASVPVPASAPVLAPVSGQMTASSTSASAAAPEIAHAPAPAPGRRQRGHKRRQHASLSSSRDEQGASKRTQQRPDTVSAPISRPRGHKRSLASAMSAISLDDDGDADDEVPSAKRVRPLTAALAAASISRTTHNHKRTQRPDDTQEDFPSSKRAHCA